MKPDTVVAMASATSTVASNVSGWPAESAVAMPAAIAANTTAGLSWTLAITAGMRLASEMPASRIIAETSAMPTP